MGISNNNNKIETILKLYLISILLSVLSACGGGGGGGDAQDFSSDSGSAAEDQTEPFDVQLAIDAAEDGDTVLIPAGNISVSEPIVISDKAITLQGAGVDQTVIIDNTSDVYRQEPLIAESSEAKPVRITGITFSGMRKRSATEPAIIISGQGWRIDHCKFTTTEEGRGVMASGTGVIDHCTFVDTKQGIAVSGDGVASWQRPLSLGTANAVFIEDCLFDYSEPLDGALDAYSGARYVFRHNTLNNTGVGHHGADSGGYRSTHSFEIYENTFTFNVNGFRAVGSRGGTGVAFNNTVIDSHGGLNYFFRVSLYRSCLSYEPWGICDGSNANDGNQEANGYPCMDQTGRTTDEDGDGIQDLAPTYEWNNTVNGGDGDIEIHNAHNCAAVYDHLQEGRDYINDTPMPGYTTYTYPHPFVID